MRTRFPRRWCDECKHMVFAGDCAHGRVEAPPAGARDGELIKWALMSLHDHSKISP